jgi:signal transduction histidine kinase/CheY-like chemotaxis protein/PAS domain-containing protein
MRTTGRYSVAFIATAVAMGASVALSALIEPMPLFFYWVAVFATAVAAGLGPALVVVVLSIAATAYLRFEPVGSLAVRDTNDIVRLMLFASFAAAISVVASMRRRAEERARRSERRYRSLIEATPLPQVVWTATPEGEIRWPEGWSAADVQPGDLARTTERWRAAVTQRTYYEDEIRVRTKDGRDRWFAIKAVPTGDEWVGIIADIDERKRHEQNADFINRASEVLASSLGVDVTLRGLAGLCVPEIADSCAIDIAAGDGYDRVAVRHVDPAKEELIRDVGRKAQQAPESSQVLRVLRSGTAELLDAPSTSDPLLKALGISSAAMVPMKARGRTVGVLSLVYNESGRHYSEEDLPLIEEIARRAATALDNARLYEAAEAANRAKDEFLATLSHELRTPLTAISGWAHMLQLGIADEETSRLAIDTIMRSARAQGELIDDLLDLSRVVAGTLHLTVTTVDMASLVAEVAVAARPAADAKGLTVQVEGGLRPLLVRGDERRLRQVVWNLVSNAVKFTDAGGTIRIVPSARGNVASISVVDTGRGIAPDFLPYVWDRFRQGDSSTSRQHGGLGLGLAVVRHLVELHGGTVAVRSDGLGRGATFCFELPLAREPAGIGAAGALTDGDLLRGRSVVLVEDDPDTRMVIATMLRQFGADVVATASVEEAVLRLEAQRPDAIVTDIAMPEQDGYALLRRVRETSNVPIVAVSAIATGAEDRRRALDAGFADFLRKPLEPAQLALAVSAAVR